MDISYIVRLNITWYVVGFSLYLRQAFSFTPTLHSCQATASPRQQLSVFILLSLHLEH